MNSVTASVRLEPLLEGLQVTIELTAVSMVIGTVLALAAGLARMARLRVVRWCAVTYIEVFRGTSLVVQLFWFFFVLPIIGISFTPMTAAILALSLNTGAFGAELVRGAVQAVPRGQTEAAIALNMGPWLRIRRVIMPQALIALLPPYGNLLIELLKGTSLASLVTLGELTFQGQILRQTTPSDTAVIFAIVLLMYFALASLITVNVRLLERRLGRGMDIGRQSRGVPA